MARAAVAAGADGLLIEVHPDPDHALSDGAQSLRPEQFEELMGQLRMIAPAVGRTHLNAETVAIVGDGLIGASFGLALREGGLYAGRHSAASARRTPSRTAVAAGAIDYGAPLAEAAVRRPT